MNHIPILYQPELFKQQKKAAGETGIIKEIFSLGRRETMGVAGPVMYSVIFQEDFCRR